MRRSASALAMLAVPVVVMGLGLPPVYVAAAPRAQTTPPPPGANLSLVSQSPWVGAGGDFTLRLRIGKPTPPANLEVAVTVYPAVASRSEFAVTLDNKATASSLTTLVYPVSTLVPDASGVSAVVVRVQDPGLPRETGRVSLGDEDGVYPVRVDLRQQRSDKPVDRFTTHLVHLPSPHAGQKLKLALVLPVHRPPGEPGAGDAAVDDPASLAATVEAARNLPVTLAPTPATLTALASDTGDGSAGVLAELRRVAGERPVLNAAYVPVSLPALFSAGLETDVVNQLDHGTATLTGVLQAQPDFETWLSDDPLDSRSLGELIKRRVARVIVSEAQLEPIADQKLTLTRSFLLSAGEDQLPAIAADGDLTAHFDNSGSPVLQAHQLLADLAVLYLDQPGMEGRAVVALPRRGWVPARPFVDILASGLQQNPIFEGVSVDNAFATVSPARSGRGTTLVRTPAARPGDTFGGTAPDLRNTRRHIDALATVLGRANPALGALERQQLVAESSELRSERQRQPYVSAVQEGISSEVSDIRMPEGRSITLTARRGEIPVTFQNRTGYPARVVIKVQSDKLDFPGGTDREIELARRNTIERFAVVARTSGAFPLRITLESPDGNLVIGRARLTVRSTAAAGVSVFVSLGAAAFLAIWWGRHALRGRRSRRLVTE